MKFVFTPFHGEAFCPTLESPWILSSRVLAASFSTGSVLGGVNIVLLNAISQEAAQGKVKNSKFYTQTLKEFKRTQYLWGTDLNSICQRDMTKVIYAYTTFDPRKSHRWVNVCPVAMEVLNREQMIHTLIHELSHRQGVLNEAEANYVADRSFALMDWARPFVFIQFADLLNFLSALVPELKEKLALLAAIDTSFEAESAFKKSTNYWKANENLWNAETYQELGVKTVAHSQQVWLRVGNYGFIKKRILTQ